MTDQLVVAHNIRTQLWATVTDVTTGWGVKRANPGAFLPGMYCLVGELCEVAGVASNWSTASSMTVTNDFTWESRVRSFINLVDVRSERFTVHGLGQALQEDGLGRTNILGEAKIQAVIQRVQNPVDGIYGNGNDTVSYKVVYFRYLE
jgi:hypothetical protein